VHAHTRRRDDARDSLKRRSGQRPLMGADDDRRPSDNDNAGTRVLVVAINIVADLLLAAGLSYVMSRAARLTTHVASVEARRHEQQHRRPLLGGNV
jgi:anti-sigma-K factor RskA